MISIIIPLYNKEKQIQKTLDSVFSQTLQDFEVIIVNDGSTDNSVSAVKDYCKANNIQLLESCNNIYHDQEALLNDFIPVIRLINQANSGVSAARNTGIENAQGEFVALLDADDEWKPDYLETQANLIKKYPEASVFVTNYEFKNEKGEIKPTIIRKLPFDGEDGIITNYFEVASYSHPPLWTSAIVVKKEAYKAISGFPLGITHGEDLITWARLACNYIIGYNKKPLAYYCLSPGYGVNSTPINIPPSNAVGTRLEELLLSYKGEKKHLKVYIGRWYKIRSNLFIRGGERRNALFNILRTIKFKPDEYPIYVYCFFLFIPKNYINKIFQIITKIKK